jgi:DNA-binding MarR family transcriptional regulator
MRDARDRVLLTLKDGPAYPTDIAETCGMPLGTVKNEINRLRKHGLVKYTGETDPRTRARQVRLTDKRCGVTGVTDPIAYRGL